MYQPIILPHFRKILWLYRKKYRHITQAVADVLDNFHKESHTSLGHGLYKVRLKVKDINKGKRGGFRLIVFILEVEKFIVPVSLYFKGDRDNLTKSQLSSEFDIIVFELKLQGLIRK